MEFGVLWEQRDGSVFGLEDREPVIVAVKLRIDGDQDGIEMRLAELHRLEAGFQIPRSKQGFVDKLGYENVYGNELGFKSKTFHHLPHNIAVSDFWHKRFLD